MKRWIIWAIATFLIIALVAGVSYVTIFADQPVVSNLNDIKKEWQETEVNSTSIQELSKSVRDEDIISEIEISQLDDSFNVQVIMNQTLQHNKTMQLGGELLTLLFQNEEMNYITLTLYPDNNNETFMQIRADQSKFMANDDLLSGIERMTMINGE
ncbi:hypothetical protein [Lentibacillus salinarum]|uniref:DUF4825 domain-containing protein n=1 Tax=Lentibacillus salinarum TaxID=446820 RepID=A0ABW3ZX64_9BACI